MASRQEDALRRGRVLLLIAALVVSGARTSAEEGLAKLPGTAWPLVRGLAGINVKANPDDAVQIIIFFDPNCPVCARLWKRIYNNDGRYGKTATRWVPVAHMSAQSLGKAAALLSIGDPKSLAVNFDYFDESRSLGGIAGIGPSLAISASLKRNFTYWEKFGAATPTLVYRKADGSTMLQVGLMPEPAFAAMMRSLRPASLQDYK